MASNQELRDEVVNLVRARDAGPEYNSERLAGHFQGLSSTLSTSIAEQVSAIKAENVVAMNEGVRSMEGMSEDMKRAQSAALLQMQHVSDTLQHAVSSVRTWSEVQLKGTVEAVDGIAGRLTASTEGNVSAGDAIALTHVLESLQSNLTGQLANVRGSTEALLRKGVGINSKNGWSCGATRIRGT